MFCLQPQNHPMALILLYLQSFLFKARTVERRATSAGFPMPAGSSHLWRHLQLAVRAHHCQAKEARLPKQQKMGFP